jgi:hypothetical protein
LASRQQQNWHPHVDAEDGVGAGGHDTIYAVHTCLTPPLGTNTVGDAEEGC